MGWRHRQQQAVTGQELDLEAREAQAELEAHLADIGERARSRADVVHARLAALEDEHATLHSLIAEIG